jgi:hypothetical protein
MKTKLIAGSCILGVALLSGCATPLNSAQKQELQAYQAKGLAVQEKDPSTAAAFGILPGGGSFYTRNVGLGIVNLLFWPLSIFWDPVSGHDGAESINYFATKASVQKAAAKEMRDTERALEEKSITQEQYLKKKREIETKYSADM